jgi:AmmeMemoRadiSam system protein B
MKESSQWPSRKAAVAGLFYPGHKDTLSQTVGDLMTEASQDEPPVREGLKAIIVPHAGYIYSGLTAARAFRRVSVKPKRIILVGPAHRAYVNGISAGAYSSYSCPMGSLEVDGDAITSLAHMGHTTTLYPAHAQEHCLEVMLPFIIHCFGAEVPIVPLLAGGTTVEALATTLEAIRRPDDLIVVSSDLSHFQPYDVARAQDLATLDRIVTQRNPEIGPEDACGCTPILGIKRIAHTQGWDIEQVDYLNSGDTGGDRTRVVGYGAVALYAR